MEIKFHINHRSHCSKITSLSDYRDEGLKQKVRKHHCCSITLNNERLSASDIRSYKFQWWKRLWWL